MALKISDDCISCGACQSECPNEAIFAGGDDYEANGKKISALSQDHYFIAPEKCMECAGDEPKCASVCPIEACQK